jgi:beta-lactam-binding protein with PASTA domain
MTGTLDGLTRPARFRRAVVPDVVGQPVSEAARVLGRLGLRVATRTDVVSPPPIEGTVVAQAPPAGSRRRRATWVTLDLAFPPPRG